MCLCLGVGLVSATKSVDVSVHLQASCSETNTHVGTAPESPVHVDPARWPAKGTVTRIRSSCDAGLKQRRNTHPTGPHPLRTLAAQLPSLDRGACWQHISRCIARARQRSCVCGGTGRSSLSLLPHGTVHLIASSRPRNPFFLSPTVFSTRHATQRTTQSTSLESSLVVTFRGQSRHTLAPDAFSPALLTWSFQILMIQSFLVVTSWVSVIFYVFSQDGVWWSTCKRTNNYLRSVCSSPAVHVQLDCSRVRHVRFAMLPTFDFGQDHAHCH